MNPGDVALARIPQDVSVKLRPILLLKEMPKYNDFLVCAISSQLHQFISGFDLLIDIYHPRFRKTGLQKSSVARLGNLAVLPVTNIAGTIGNLDIVDYQTLIKTLSEYLIK